MKKTLLLASAAVLFAGSANAMEKGLELGIEGYASVYGVYVNQDSVGDNRSEFGLKREMELDFTGEVALENGLTVGATIELQQDANNADEDEDVQESYIYVEGGFGKVIVGQEYNAAYLMQVAAPSVDAEFDGMDPTYNVITTRSTSAGVIDQSYDMSAQHRTSNADAPVGDKVTYISPIWEGLQLGASYTPDTATTNSQGAMPATTTEAYAIAGRYAVDLWDIDWTVGAGWNNTETAGVDADFDQWNVAVTAEFDAWDMGVAYYETDGVDVASEELAIAAGVNYETGNMNYGVSYMYKEVGDNDDVNRYMGGVNYTYGPGMTLNGSVSFNEYTASSTSDETDATVVAIGTVINF